MEKPTGVYLNYRKVRQSAARLGQFTLRLKDPAKIGPDFLAGVCSGEGKVVTSIPVTQSGKTTKVPLSKLKVPGDFLTMLDCPDTKDEVPSVGITIVRDRDGDHKAVRSEVLLIHATNHTEVKGFVPGHHYTLAYKMLQAVKAGAPRN